MQLKPALVTLPILFVLSKKIFRQYFSFKVNPIIHMELLRQRALSFHVKMEENCFLFTHVHMLLSTDEL